MVPTFNKTTPVDRNKILSELYNSERFNEAIRKAETDRSLHHDLKHEVFLKLCSLSDEKLQSICESCKENEGLTYYAVRILWNEIRNTHSADSFNQKYRDGNSILGDVSNFGELIAPEVDLTHDVLNVIAEAQKDLHWYNAMILDLYASNNCNAAEVSRLTQIPERSVRHTVQKTRELIKQRISELLSI